MGLRSRSRSGRRRVAPSPLAVRLSAGFAVCLLVLGGGYLWLRESSLVRIENVEVVGVSSEEGAKVTAALERAGKQMTTLAVSETELREAVDRYPSVGSLRVQTSFPNDLTVEVRERHPVAAAAFGDLEVPVAADGRLMRGTKSDGRLAEVPVGKGVDTARLRDPRSLAAVEVLAAAPAALRDVVVRASYARKGMILELRDGPLLIFGDGSRPRAKWAATSRVLADQASAGAVYLDVRVPERVAAGGLGAAGVTPPEANPQVQPEINPSLDS